MNKWISVEEQLPEHRQAVLTWWPARQQIQLQTYYTQYATDDAWWMFGWQNLLVESGDITHWMPLPEGPVQESEE